MGKSEEFFLKFRQFFPSSIFPNKFFFPMKNFACRTHFFKCKLKLKSRQSLRNEIRIVNMVEDSWILEWFTLLIKKKCMWMSLSLLQINFQQVMRKLFQFLDLSFFFDGSSLQKKSWSFHHTAQLRWSLR